MAKFNLQDYAINDLSKVPQSEPFVPTTPTVNGPATPGAFQFNTGGQATAIPPAYSSAPVAPVVPAAPATKPVVAPTAGEVMGTGTPAAPAAPATPTAPQTPGVYHAPSPLDGPDAPWTPLSAKEEEAFRQRQMSLFQSQIDATNQIYDQMLRREQQQGQGRLGSVGSTGARAGILGSDFQSANEQNMQTQNNQLENGIQAQRAAAIGAILGQARSDAANEIAAKNLANRQGADAKIAYLASRSDRREKNLGNLAKSFVDQGIDPASLSPEEMKSLTDTYGIPSSDILSAYKTSKVANDLEKAKTSLSTKKTEAEINKINAEIAQGKWLPVGEGTMLYNPETGEKIKNPKTATPVANTTFQTGAYNSDLDAMIGSLLANPTSKYGEQAFIQQLGRARNDADRLNLIATRSYSQMSAADRTDVKNQVVSLKSINDAIDMLDSGTKTGLINSGLQYSFNKFGTDYNPELAKINSKIITALQLYRNTVTGAAWGTQETDEYNNLFGSTRFSPTALRTRLESMKDNLTSKTTQALSMSINPIGTYSNPYSGDNIGTNNDSSQQQTGDPEYDAYLRSIGK